LQFSNTRLAIQHSVLIINQQTNNIMRHLVIFSAFLLALLSTSVTQAQEAMQDVIYLKNGSIYKGTIIEEVPNTSYKIRIAGGSVIAVQLADIERLTKEDLPNGTCGRGMRDTTRFVARKKGYFNVLQVLIENKQGGVRFVNGYKFGRFGYLGIGVGFDRVFSSPLNGRINGLQDDALEGIYLPLYLFYSGDVKQRRLTPYYTFEAGYTMAFKGMDGQFESDAYGRRPLGGPMAGVGLGLKFHPLWAKGHHVSILFNLNYKMVRYEEDVLLLNNVGQIIGTETGVKAANMLFPGIRVGVGF
jgi:hypothetical protein